MGLKWIRNRPEMDKKWTRNGQEMDKKFKEFKRNMKQTIMESIVEFQMKQLITRVL